ncbi:MAG: DegT/DnrJ/EryC1/StrS family aminotransferase [Desulfosudaceae bacterium]
MNNSKINVAEPCVGEEEAEAIRQVLLSGQYASGPKVAEFESAFAKYIGTSYAAAVPLLTATA